MNLIQHRTDLTEIGLGFTGYFPFPDFWSLGSGISAKGPKSQMPLPWRFDKNLPVRCVPGGALGGGGRLLYTGCSLVCGQQNIYLQ